MNNKKFWSTVKPFRISKGVFAEHQKNIRIEGDIINDKKHLVELFNKHYTNIVKTTSRKKIISSISLGDPWNPEPDEITVDEIIEKYKKHPRFKQLKILFIQENYLIYPKHMLKTIRIVNSSNTKKSTEPDRISAKFIHISANVIDSY